MAAHAIPKKNNGGPGNPVNDNATKNPAAIHSACGELKMCPTMSPERSLSLDDRVINKPAANDQERRDLAD